MREVKEQLWQAGKYAAVGIVVLGTLPVLLPSVFVLSVLLFSFVIPLLCALAGFLCLQKHATMLYRYLPGASRRSSGADSSHRRLPPSSLSGSFTLLELLRKDSDSIDTFEAVDHEFDAVLVNTKPKFEKVVPEDTSPWVDAVQQFETRKEKDPVLEQDEASQKTMSAESFTDCEEFQTKNVDRDECHEEAFAIGLLKGGTGGRQEEKDCQDDEREQELCNTEDASVLEDKFTENLAASGFSNGAINPDRQFVGTVPSKCEDYNLYDDEEKDGLKMSRTTDSPVVTGEKWRVTGEEYLGAMPTNDVWNTYAKVDDEDGKEHEGVTENSSCSESEREGGLDLIASCTNSSEGVGDVQRPKEEEKNFRNDETNSEVYVYEDELANVREHRMTDITSEDSVAVNPEVVATGRDVSGPNPVDSSGASRPESVSLDSASIERFGHDESASGYESFESISDGLFDTPQSEKELNFEDEESFDGDGRDDSSFPDERSYHYEVNSEAQQRRDRGGEDIAQAPEKVLREDELRSMFSFPLVENSVYPSTTYRDSDSSEEKACTMKSSISASTFSEDMSDSEEQLHLQQFGLLLQFWRGKEFQTCSPTDHDHAMAQNQHRFRLFRRPQQQVHDEEERQLRQELKALKIVVGDEEASSGPLANDIEELSQILGIELPSMSDDIPELEWAKVAVEVMKVVVGME